jgi:hypothetical protein
MNEDSFEFRSSVYGWLFVEVSNIERHGPEPDVGLAKDSIEFETYITDEEGNEVDFDDLPAIEQDRITQMVMEPLDVD